MTDDASRRQLEYVAAASAVFNVTVFTFVGHLVFRDPLWGAVTGILVGVGTFLFLPGLVLAGQYSAGQIDAGTAGSGDPAAAATDGRRREPDRTAAGVALTVAGLGVMAAGFAVPGDLGLAVLLGTLVGAVGYLPTAWLLPTA